MPVITRTTASREEVSRLIHATVASLAGNSGEASDIAHKAYIVMAVEFFSLVKDAYVTKARGGTDEAGIKWPPLTKKYLAYGRGPASSRRLGGHSPGGGDGALTKSQLDKWWKYYGQAKAWLAASESGKALKSHAAAIAWSKIKKEGAKTKLEVLGNRPAEILRDRGILLNSLSPGIPGRDSYEAPDGQIFDPAPGQLTVGTNVPYAAAHHNGTGGVPKRPLWPEPQNIPGRWWSQMLAPVAEV
ncbi:MAG: hypothetical protein GY953_05835, partial [bacterium]|nr:hypothetical protein [bacterium]